jgi:hypothetical protein
MLRGALLLAIITSIVASIASYFLIGLSGLLGSVLAGFTVLIFFSISLMIGRLTRNADPMATMALAMLSYFTKLLVIAAFLILVTRLTDADTVNRRAFGISAIGITFAWLVGEVRTFFRLRLQLPLPIKEQPSSEQSRTEEQK